MAAEVSIGISTRTFLDADAETAINYVGRHMVNKPH